MAKQKLNAQSKRKETNIVWIIIFILVGFLAGILGSLIFNPYSYQPAYLNPFVPDIDLTNLDYNRSNLVIRDAKKVVVNQDVKIEEALASARTSLVGVFFKKTVSANEEFDLADYYSLEAELAEGLIVSSDGWVLVNLSNLASQQIVGRYVAIDLENQIYDIDQVLPGAGNGFSFVHLSGANNLPVKNFVAWSDINLGEAAIIADWENNGLFSTVMSKKNNSGNIRFSDVVNNELVLVDDQARSFIHSFVFNLSSEVLGFVDSKGIIHPINDIRAKINSLLLNKTITSPSFGVYYLDLSSLVREGEKNNKGALIWPNAEGVAVVKDSPAEILGLQSGDIISYVNNIEINRYNDLAVVLQNFKVDDKIDLRWVRDGQEMFGQLRLGTK